MTAWASVAKALTGSRVAQVLTRAMLGRLLYPDMAAEGASVVDPGARYFDVTRYGADPTGVADSLPAFDAAWAALRQVGGELVIPPGEYQLSGTWVLNINDGVATPYPRNYKIRGWGAKLFAAGVTGPAVQVIGAYNEFLTDIEGVSFDHRGNATVAGCIEILGGHCVRVARCTVEMHSVRAGYYFVSLDTKIQGATEDDYNAFWCVVEGCSTRKRSGGETGEITYGIKMRGAVNAFKARDNTISNCAYGIYAEPAGTTKTLPNAVIIDGNDFETISGAAIHVQMEAGQLGPTGWRVVHNRVETTDTFFSLDTGGGSAIPHTQPPLLFGNYCTGGSVNTWVNNPTSYPVSVLETRHPDYGPAVENVWWMRGGLTLNMTYGGLVLMDKNGYSDYSRANIVFGGHTVWLNESSSKLYLKNGVPANNSDGSIVGPP